jgi:hypothetical protein
MTLVENNLPEVSISGLDDLPAVYHGLMTRRGRVWVVSEPSAAVSRFRHMSVFMDLAGFSIYSEDGLDVPERFNGLQVHLLLKCEGGVWRNESTLHINVIEDFDTSTSALFMFLPRLEVIRPLRTKCKLIVSPFSAL